MNVQLEPARLDEYVEYFDGTTLVSFSTIRVEHVLGIPPGAPPMVAFAIMLQQTVRLDGELKPIEYWLQLPIRKFTDFANRLNY